MGGRHRSKKIKNKPRPESRKTSRHHLSQGDGTKAVEVRNMMETTIYILGAIAGIGLTLAGYLLSFGHKTVSIWVLFPSLVISSLVLCLYLQNQVWERGATNSPMQKTASISQAENSNTKIESLAQPHSSVPLSKTESIVLPKTDSPTKPKTNRELNSPESYDVEIVFENGEIVNNAQLRCGPHGWSSYDASFQYTRDLDVIRKAEYGPKSGRFIGFDKISRIDFLKMNDQEKNIINQNQTYRYWVRKVKLTLNDGTIWDNTYLLEFCHFKAKYEEGALNDNNAMQPKSITIRLKD